MKKFFYTTLLLAAATAVFGQAQINNAGDVVVITFDNSIGGVSNGGFNGSGFDPIPESGELNSNAFRISGFSDGPLNFGDNFSADGTSSTQFSSGSQSGAVAAPGVYAYTGSEYSAATPSTITSPDPSPGAVTAAGVSLLIQPSSTEFGSGELVVRAENATGGNISSLDVSLDFCARNNSDAASSYEVSYSTTDAPGSYTPLITINTAATAFTLPFPPFTSPLGCINTGMLSVSGLDIAPNGFFYLRIAGSTVGAPATTDRDEVLVDNVTFSSIVLPVELTYFGGEAIEEGVRLDWETVVEVNNDFFEIQRSTDGVTFRPIATVAGQGTTNQAIQYAYVDNLAPAGINYYRLRQVDFDGTEDFTDVISVLRGDESHDKPITVAPNPTTDLVQVRCALPFSVDTQLQLFAADGRLLEQYAAAGRTQIEINLSGLPAGTYQLRMIDARRVQHFAVQKL